MSARLGRAAIGLGVTALQVLVAVLVLGLPDLRAALAFLSSPEPTSAGSIAILELLLWLILAIASIVAVVAAAREASALVPIHAFRRGWGVAVLVAGCSLLVAGAVHQLAPPAVDLQGGGSVTEATQELGR
ncbi:MAG: hypothetical protein WAM30_19110 [Candidatus Dormiibacterota bacterium]